MTRSAHPAQAVSVPLLFKLIQVSAGI